MVISQENPSPGIKSASLKFPLTDRYETGSYAFVIEAKALFEPRMITTSCYKEPLFAIRVDLNTSTGEMLASIGLADNRLPQSLSFLLPRYIKDLPEHRFEISFQNWQILSAKMDAIPLQIAPNPTEIILIHHGIESVVSVWDLLRPNGTIPLKLSGDFDSWNGLSLFWLFAENYEFHLFVDANELVLRRSGYEVRTPIKPITKSMVWVTWAPTQINLYLSENPLEACSTITTISTPPKSLFQLARAKKLQPTNSFASVDSFRTSIHEALCSLQYDIAEAGAYNGFWDQNYQGKRKHNPTPKKETRHLLYWKCRRAGFGSVLCRSEISSFKRFRAWFRGATSRIHVI
jgi:hypothetical protein